MRGSAIRPLWLASMWEFLGITVLFFFICAVSQVPLSVRGVRRPPHYIACTMLGCAIDKYLQITQKAQVIVAQIVVSSLLVGCTLFAPVHTICIPSRPCT